MQVAWKTGVTDPRQTQRLRERKTLNLRELKLRLFKGTVVNLGV